MVKVKLDSIDKVKLFVDATFKTDADLLLKHGKYAVDGRSTMGILSLNLSEVLELEIIEKNLGETEAIIRTLDGFGLLV